MRGCPSVRFCSISRSMREGRAGRLHSSLNSDCLCPGCVTVGVVRAVRVVPPHEEAFLMRIPCVYTRVGAAAVLLLLASSDPGLAARQGAEDPARPEEKKVVTPPAPGPGAFLI